MKFLKNPQATKVLSFYTLVSVIAVVVAFLKEPKLSVYVLGLCVIFVFIYCISTYKQYKKIANISADITRILHGDTRIFFKDYSEGELGILQSEIQKMTVMLREQQQNLQDDKVYLADSIADISHQIKTPLTSINLIVSFLSEPNLEEERRIKLISEIRNLLNRIDLLITILLRISKLDAGVVEFKKESVTLSELIKKSTEALLIPIEIKGQSLIVDAVGDFHGDVSWTSEAISNILKNCMEHTAIGKEIHINASENALYTEIVISDNGCGIDKEDLPHIFERFYKGKGSDDKSFGIGLAFARMIVTLQNGTIKVENISDGGAMFTIRFYKGIV